MNGPRHPLRGRTSRPSLRGAWHSRHCERAAHCQASLVIASEAKQSRVKALPGWIASPLCGSQ
ncbi:MAG: hypothetical protein LBT00_00595 [Spirochaetaceae bacterium]|nr:hypothetical protein [Spirochaetaceae bacterium]